MYIDNFILEIGESGWYTLLSLGSDTELFNKTERHIQANKLTPFGFSFKESHSENITPSVEAGLAKTRKLILKTLIEKLEEKRKKIGADYVLIEINEDSYGKEKTPPGIMEWRIDIKCQFFQKIAFEHVPPTRVH